MKRKPNAGVLHWMESCQDENMYLSALTIGELESGILRLPASDRRTELQRWLVDGLIPRFGIRILAFDVRVARLWGQMLAVAHTTGHTLPVVDSQIAATGVRHALTIVTRNERHFVLEGAEVQTFNPWS
jgi:toxin FitB